MTPIELWETKAFYESDRFWTAYFGMFYGILLVMMLYNRLVCLSTQDRSYLFYRLYLAAFFRMNLAYIGFAFQYFWPTSPRWGNWSCTFWIFLYQIMAIQFAMVFLETRSRLPSLHRGMAPSNGEREHGTLQCNTSLFCLFSHPVVGLSSRTLFVLATTASLLGVFISALTVSGFLPYAFANFHAAEFGIMADVVLLSLELTDRINFL